MITLDASMLVAHLSPHDLHHDQATALMEARAGEELVVHPLNLAEVLVGGVRAGRGEDMLSDIEAIGVRVADRSTGAPLRLAHLRVSQGLKLPDCCALDTAMSTGSILATVNEGLAAAARRCAVAVEPAR